MLTDLIWLMVGFACVIKGGDWFVDSSIHIARKFNIPRAIVGGTLVSLATTLPELTVSLTASLLGDSGIALGNALGSAIANMGLIVGVMAVMVRLDVDVVDFPRRSFWLILTALTVFIFSWNLSVNRPQGVVLMALAFGYLIYDYLNARKASKANRKETEEGPITKPVVFFIVGAALILVGSRLMVTSGISLAKMMNIPTIIIGLTVIAVGTSLPELVTAITAARKKVPDLAIGNILGANILNLGLIIGTSAVAHPLSLTEATRNYSFPWLFVFMLLLYFPFKTKQHFNRLNGICLLTGYVLYVLGLVLFPFLKEG